MAFECDMQKSLYCNQMIPPAKRLCIDTSFADKILDEKLNSSNNMSGLKPIDDPTSTICDDNATTFSDISYDSICTQINQESLTVCDDKDILKEFFINLNLPTDNSSPYDDQQINKTNMYNDVQPTISATPASNSTPVVKKNGCYIAVFQQQLGKSLFLTLKLRNNKYNVHICEIKHDTISANKTSSKKGIYIDMQSWYEFQYKMFSFNMTYKSASFVANNTILVLNMNNSIMQIKHLKYYCHVDLNAEQLGSLKKMIPKLNKELLNHMYGKHLPCLIKRKCAVKEMTQEESLEVLKILCNCIEENLVSILHRIYECYACISGENCTKSLHPCSTLNNREKCEQLGINILLLVNLDFVLNTFINRMDCISDLFLSNLNVENIYSTLFKAIK